MPELPEVETIARGLEFLVLNKIITGTSVFYPKIINGDPDLFLKNIVHQRINRVWRRAKLLIFDLSDSSHLVFHLKMTGKVWTPHKDICPDKHTHIVFHLDDGGNIFFQDQRKFGYCALFNSDELKSWKFFAELGPEPLQLPQDEFVRIFSSKKGRIKALLLDQKIISGIGNIYADESLFMSGIHPETPGNRLSIEELQSLHHSLRKVLTQAIDAGGSSFRDYRNALGFSGMFQDNFLVYGKKGQSCPICGMIIQTCKVGGRTSSICPACQICQSGRVLTDEITGSGEG